MYVFPAGILQQRARRSVKEEELGGGGGNFNTFRPIRLRSRLGEGFTAISCVYYIHMPNANSTH